MGYTTVIDGEFGIMPTPTDEFKEEVNIFLEDRHDGEDGCPGIWCHWRISNEGTLKWSGAEKFYDYAEWLEFLIEKFFKSNGYQLFGSVGFRGERAGDLGYIEIENDRVLKSHFEIDYWGDEFRIELGHELCKKVEEILWKGGISLEEATLMFIEWIVDNSEYAVKVLSGWKDEQKKKVDSNVEIKENLYEECCFKGR